MHLRPLRYPQRIAPECVAPYIRILHPGYFTGENVLFALPPLDVATDEDETDARDATSSILYGVHHATVLVACQIIAGNAFDTAYLTYGRNGQERIQIAREGLLTRKEYYLQLPDGSDTVYPITPNFQEWRFPHGALPEPWASLPNPITNPSLAEAEATISPAGSRCMITADGPSAVDSAHVIPQSEVTSDWFNNNMMERYSESNNALAAINRLSNICRLRADLHRNFDARAFTFVPKPTSSREKRHSLAVHFLYIRADLRGPATQFHNQLVHDTDIPPEYMFARFAYTVFGLLKNFVLTGSQRQLTVVERGKMDWITKTYQMDFSQRDRRYGGSGSRSSSPRKRVRGSANSQQAIDDNEPLEGFWHEFLEEEQARKTRTRSWVFSDDSADGSEDDQPKEKKRRVSAGEQQQTPSITSASKSLFKEEITTGEQREAGNKKGETAKEIDMLLGG